MNDETPIAAESPTFAQTLEALEQLVVALERGDLELETSLAEYERGIALVRQCRQALSAAELRVRVLTESSSGTTLEPQPESRVDD